MPADPPTVEQIFEEALRRPAGPERRAFLDGACGGDAGLRDRIEALLSAHEAAGAFLDQPALANGGTLATTPPEGPGTTIDRYKLLQMIGEGGFGVVYMAEQTRPVKRRVALKVIKAGMDTKQVIARFEAERQALALMDHPHIAKVLDAGATEVGRPYFVMELVKGVPITEYCDRENLSTRQRLELFAEVCSAVQHAHQKGIIHRDLKPSNVMVTLHDGAPVPKVIDFGIAKATNRELTDRTLFTEYRQFIGTPEYMSPEQAEMSGLDIDTRSDIYSLGVLLYELLTGLTPFDGERLRSAALGEIQRIIREEEPPRPSTRHSTEDAARHRRTDPSSLSRQLRGDLDWIVMKALEKDRSRRYETANGFALDIGRYLNDEPVAAMPPSATYRLRKLVKRNKGAFAAAASVLVVLVLGIAGTTWGLIAARAEADRAERELARASEVKRLITEMFNGVSPEVAAGVDTTLLEGILDDTADRLRSGAVDDELIAAELHGVVGNVYTGLGRFADAERHLTVGKETYERRLGDEDPRTLDLMNDLAVVYWEAGDYEDAEMLYQHVLEVERGTFGPDHRGTLETTNNLAVLRNFQGRFADAVLLITPVLETQRRLLGDDHPETLTSMHTLASALEGRGRLVEAEQLHLEMLHHLTEPDDPFRLSTTNNLATLYWKLGRYDEAEPMMTDTLERRRRVLGDTHPDTLLCMTNMAALLRERGRVVEALAMYRQTLEVRKDVLPADHVEVLRNECNLAVLQLSCGLHDEAEGAFVAMLERAVPKYGKEHPDVLRSMHNLSTLYRLQGRLEKAEKLARETLDIARNALGPEHLQTLQAAYALAVALYTQREFAEAEAVLRPSYEIQRRVLGRTHPDTITSLGALANFDKVQGRYEQAEAKYLEALAATRSLRGDEHPDTRLNLENLARLYQAQGRLEEAAEVLRELLEVEQGMVGEMHSMPAATLARLADVWKDQGAYEEAERCYRRAIRIYREALGDEDRRTLGETTNLGLLYNEMERYEDAVPVFETSLPIKQRTLGIEHSWTRIAMRGLARACAALGRDDRAIALHRELLEYECALVERPEADAGALNEAAWSLLTHELEALRDADRALGYARRACSLEEGNDGKSLWMCLDTLALAQHRTGDSAAALVTQEWAMSLIPDDAPEQTVAGMQANLELFERAVESSSDRASGEAPPPPVPH